MVLERTSVADFWPKTYFGIKLVRFALRPTVLEIHLDRKWDWYTLQKEKKTCNFWTFFFYELEVKSQLTYPFDIKLLHIHSGTTATIQTETSTWTTALAKLNSLLKRFIRIQMVKINFHIFNVVNCFIMNCVIGILFMCHVGRWKYTKKTFANENSSLKIEKRYFSGRKIPKILQAKAQANSKTAEMCADFILKNRHYAQSLMNDMNSVDGILFIKNRKQIEFELCILCVCSFFSSRNTFVLGFYCSALLQFTAILKNQFTFSAVMRHRLGSYAGHTLIIGLSSWHISNVC